MRETGMDMANAFGTVLIEDNLERAMMKALLPMVSRFESWPSI
jgi:hypothetical protein